MDFLHDDSRWKSAIDLLRKGDKGHALEVLTELSEDGDTSAMSEIGMIYEFGGKGIEPDASRAFHWYERAGKEGDLEGILGSARLYFKGEGLPEDYNFSRSVYEEIVQQIEEPRALFGLGQIYQFGLGVSPDEDVAMDFYRRAGLNGHLLAPKFMARLQWNRGRYLTAIIQWVPAITRIVWNGLLRPNNFNLHHVI